MRRKQRGGGWFVADNSSPIVWGGRKQKTVSLSSTEAEYLAASEAARAGLWIRGFMAELRVAPPGPSILRIDSSSALAILNGSSASHRRKQIDVVHHFAREQVEKGTLSFEKIGTADNVADIFTKPLPSSSFTKHRAH